MLGEYVIREYQDEDRPKMHDMRVLPNQAISEFLDAKRRIIMRIATT